MRIKVRYEDSSEVLWVGERDALILSERFPPVAVAAVAMLQVGETRHVRDENGDGWEIEGLADPIIGVKFTDWTGGPAYAFPQRRIFDNIVQFDAWQLYNRLDDRDIQIHIIRDDLDPEDRTWWLSLS
jgi:hypothetical protein